MDDKEKLGESVKVILSLLEAINGAIDAGISKEAALKCAQAAQGAGDFLRKIAAEIGT